MTEQKYLKIDSFQKITEQGVFACGDNTTMMRSVSHTVALVGIVGAMTNREIIEERF